MKGIHQRRRIHYGSVDYTTIAIEADESTPLLVARVIYSDDNSNYKNNRIITKNGKPVNRYGLSSWPLDSKHSSRSTGSLDSKKSFISHFLELKVVALALFLSAALSIAIYLLVIDTRLPPVTFSLDLIGRDIWNRKLISNHYHHLIHNNVDHIILMQTGNRSCDTSEECFEILKEMQNNEPGELPFNFLIGGDGQTYEVRGWKYQSGRKGILQEQSLVIGIIGNFDQKPPKNNILLSIKSLIQLSSKRQLINAKYYIYGLLQSHREPREGQQLFDNFMELAEFEGFLTNYQG